MKIKADGNGRDPDFGIIFDDKTELGFRKKTDEDIELIDKYTDMVGERFIIDDSLINLLDSISKGEDVSHKLLEVLEDYYVKQMNYIDRTRNNLKEFYNSKDSKLIKDSYLNAFNSYIEDLNFYKISHGVGYYNFIDMNIANNEYLSNEDLINYYIELIKRNNIIINNFKIKHSVSASDTDYNVIIDNNSELGFRIKTDEDKIIIDVYSNLIEESYNIGGSLIPMFENIVKYYKDNTMIKKLEK